MDETEKYFRIGYLHELKTLSKKDLLLTLETLLKDKDKVQDFDWKLSIIIRRLDIILSTGGYTYGI